MRVSSVFTAAEGGHLGGPRRQLAAQIAQDVVRLQARGGAGETAQLPGETADDRVSGQPFAVSGQPQLAGIGVGIGMCNAGGRRLAGGGRAAVRGPHQPAAFNHNPR